MSKKGLIFIISGPSGVGKGTVLAKLLEDPSFNICFNTSITTRKPRDNEIDGIHYIFVSKEDFLHKIRNNLFLEWTEYSNNYYGTSEADVRTLINNGKSVVLEIETKGMSQILSKYSKEFKIVTIFFLPPSLETLKSRLVNRQTNTTADIENRLKRANDEIKASSNYNYKIVIDNTESAYSKLHDIVEKETTKYE